MKGNMSNGSKETTKAKMFKDKTRNRVYDLREVFSSLLSARKEGGGSGGEVYVERVEMLLKEWQAELEEPSPASSLQAGGDGYFSLSSELQRLLRPSEVDDDASSVLRDHTTPKPEPDVQSFQTTNNIQGFQAGVGHVSQDHYVNPTSQEQGFQGVDQFHAYPLEGMPINKLEGFNPLDYGDNLYDFSQDYNHELYFVFNNNIQDESDGINDIHRMQPVVLPPSAFLGPTCAIWDCLRPAVYPELSPDYCSSFHANEALREGPPGPILRPGGIHLKDGPFFACLNAKILGKNVGIPSCEGAATAQAPWNAPDLFNMSILEQETLREWLFFDKPRRAFESGNRKARQLPDYAGRGWHESRKQVMAEYGGQKRSYYMDPQPVPNYEWHLFEYEINNCSDWALYRLEYKNVEGKKSPKGKVSNDPLSDLQKQMGRLAAVTVDAKRSAKGKTKASPKSSAGQNTYSDLNHASASNDSFSYGGDASFEYLVNNLDDHYYQP